MDTEEESAPEKPASPSVDVTDIHRLPPDEARALVDEKLGPSETWPSPLINYRLAAEWQDDWKVEVGQWLRSAEENGFLPEVLHQLRAQAQKSSNFPARDPNDNRHLKLHQHLAPAVVTHYLTALGWAFAAYEPEKAGKGSKVDIDLSLRTPDGTIAEFQIKAPDQPGRNENGKLVDGEYDDRVIAAVEHAATQLPVPARGPAIIAVCANRMWPLSQNMRSLLLLLIGAVRGVGRQGFLRRADAGSFFSDDWRHVAGIVVLDLVRGLDRATYACTVLTNQRSPFPLNPDWFPNARVGGFVGDTFRWFRGVPGPPFVPDGTTLVDEIPESVLRAAW